VRSVIILIKLLCMYVCMYVCTKLTCCGCKNQFKTYLFQLALTSTRRYFINFLFCFTCLAISYFFFITEPRAYYAVTVFLRQVCNRCTIQGPNVFDDNDDDDDSGNELMKMMMQKELFAMTLRPYSHVCHRRGQIRPWYFVAFVKYGTGFFF